MAKKLANDLGLKVIKLLPFQVLTQLPVGGLWGFFLPCCSYLFSVTSVLDTVCIPLQVLDDRTDLNLVFSWRSPSPCVSTLPGEPVLGLKCPRATGQLQITKLP